MPEIAVWYTLAEAAELCARSPKTIRNLVSLHQIPVKKRWLIIRHKRRRIWTLPETSVAMLQALTSDAPDDRERPKQP